MTQGRNGSEQDNTDQSELKYKIRRVKNSK